MNYIKTEWKKLGSISLIGVGAFLIIEHIYTYGYVSLTDFLGHEYFGLVLILGGFLIASRNNIKKPFNYMILKIKSVFNNGKA